MELLCGNSQNVKAIDCFHRRAPSLMLGNSVLREVSTTRVIQGNL